MYVGGSAGSQPTFSSEDHLAEIERVLASYSGEITASPFGTQLA